MKERETDWERDSELDKTRLRERQCEKGTEQEGDRAWGGQRERDMVPVLQNPGTGPIVPRHTCFKTIWPGTFWWLCKENIWEVKCQM